MSADSQNGKFGTAGRTGRPTLAAAPGAAGAAAAVAQDMSVEPLDILKIMDMIPHRHPFLLVDRVEQIELYKSAVGIKNVTINDEFFRGHFPSRPVMPGVLIIESMAQTSAVLVVASLGKEAEGKLVFFMSIDSARFRKPVEPGDVLHLDCRILRHRGNVWKFEGRALVDGKLVAEAVFAAMIMDN